MAKKTPAQKMAIKEAKRRRADYYLTLAVAVLDNPVATMIAGVSAVNLLARVKDKNGRPVLFSEGIRVGLQTAALGYPIFSQSKEGLREKLAYFGTIQAAVGLTNFMQPSEYEDTLQGRLLDESTFIQRQREIWEQMNVPLGS